MSKAVIDALVARFPGAVHDAYAGVGGDAAAFVEKDRIVEVATALKGDGFDLAHISPLSTTSGRSRASRSSTTSTPRS